MLVDRGKTFLMIYSYAYSSRMSFMECDDARTERYERPDQYPDAGLCL